MFRGVVPHLWVESVPASIAFYESVLGFEVQSTYPTAECPTWCEMSRGDAAVMLAEYPESSTPFYDLVRDRKQNRGSSILYLPVEDPDSDHRRAVEQSAKIVDPIADKFYGVREFVVEDPDGHWWSVEKELQ